MTVFIRKRTITSIVNYCLGGSSGGSEHICKEPIHDIKSISSASETELHMPTIPAMPNKNAGNGNGSNGKRSQGSRSRSSGSEQSVQTGTGSGGPQNQQDLSGSRQSFRIAMGNPYEFYVDVM